MDARFREKLVIRTKGSGNPSLKLVCHIRKLFFYLFIFTPTAVITHRIHPSTSDLNVFGGLPL